MILIACSDNSIAEDERIALLDVSGGGFASSLAPKIVYAHITLHLEDKPKELMNVLTILRVSATVLC